MTPKQKRFVKEYLVDLNATRAAISAGYSENTAESAGSRLLRNVNVKAEIDKRAQKLTEKLEITTEYVLNGIKAVVERSIQEGDEYDAFAALKGYELLGKYKKLFTDKLEVAGKMEHEHKSFDPERLTDSQLAEAERLIESAHTGSDTR